MGTRNLTCIVIDGEYKVAKYCQWDGYPSGQGILALQAIKAIISNNEMEDFKEKVRGVKELTAEEVKKKWVEAGAEPDSNMVNMDVSNKFREKYPHLHRDVGADIVDYIKESDSNHPLCVQNDLEFAADSLFCEWCYVIDLDKDTFEVFKGFNKDPISPDERFYFLEAMNEENSEYKVIKCIQKFDFQSLPDKQYFVELLNENGEDD